MLLPSHVEALRCMLVERLWKESMSIGPLPELMSDIMSYTPKPTITLDCPMEEIIVEIDCKPDMIFHDSGVVYGVSFRDHDIVCEEIWPPGEVHPVVRNVKGFVRYFDSDTGNLFILHDTLEHEYVVTLTVYDVKADKTRRHEIHELSDLFDSVVCMAVTGSHLFVGIAWSELEDNKSVEVIYKDVDFDDEARVIWSSYDGSTTLHSLRMVSARHPLSLDIVYLTNNSRMSRRVVLERSSPILEFKSMPSAIGVRPTIRKTRAGYALFDSCFKRVSPLLNLSGKPRGTLCTTDKSGGMYFLVNRRINGANSIRLVRAFPYLH